MVAPLDTNPLLGQLGRGTTSPWSGHDSNRDVDITRVDGMERPSHRDFLPQRARDRAAEDPCWTIWVEKGKCECARQRGDLEVGRDDDPRFRVQNCRIESIDFV